MKPNNKTPELDPRKLWRICGLIFMTLFLAYMMGYIAHLIYDFF